MSGYEHYYGLYGRNVIVTLVGGLKFLAFYSNFETCDDYDDKPYFFGYELQPIGAKDEKFFFDVEHRLVKKMELYDEETMVTIPFVPEEGDPRTLYWWIIEDLVKYGFQFVETAPGDSCVC